MERKRSFFLLFCVSLLCLGVGGDGKESTEEKIKNVSVLEMTSKEENERKEQEDKEDEEDPEANDAKIDIPDEMNGRRNPQPISPERNQQRREELRPATPNPEEAALSSRQMKTRIAFSIAFLTLSGAAIFGGLHERIGNESSRFNHKDLFKACSYSLYAMFFSSGCLLVLSLKGRRYNKVIDQLVCLSICGAVGSVSFAAAFALCLLLDLNRVGSALVLVFAAFPVGLVVFVVYFNGYDSAGYSQL